MKLARYLPGRLRRALKLCRSAYWELIKSPARAAELSVVSRPETSDEIEKLVILVYEIVLHRTPAREECRHWTNAVLNNSINVLGLVESIATSDEAAASGTPGDLLPEIANGKLVQYAYDVLLGRGAMAAEIAYWDHRISRQDLGREILVTSLFTQRANETLIKKNPAANFDSSVCDVMGTGTLIDVRDWTKIAESIGSNVEAIPPKIYSSLTFEKGPEILVSAVASLYRGGDYIEQFLENITSQTIFESCCELIIIDADSPEDEYEVISAYMKRYKNIVYHRASTRIGIYEAWNLGVQMARGKYVTNANLDDLRRRDSFERQVEILEKFSFVDVVYQDFYYSFDGNGDVNKAAAIGVKSDVPVITPYNLLRSNSPHNAPMWRRSLHDDVGMFDADYKSAGDYDFWLRCVEAGKVFYKINDPHVVYFVNPQGLSTQPNTRGLEEGRRVTQLHGRNLISPELLCSDEEFLENTSRAAGGPLKLSKSERGSVEWRYTAAQRALRQYSAASRKIDAGKR